MSIPEGELQALNQDVKDRGHIDREHLLKFLTLIPDNDTNTVIGEVKGWLQALHDDPEYDTITFPQGDIDAVIGDLDSYGRVNPLTIQQFKQNSTKAPPQTQ